MLLRFLGGFTCRFGGSFTRGLVASFGECVCEVALGGFVSIIAHGHGLRGYVGVYALHSLLEAQRVFYLVLTALAVHLWGSGESEGLYILCDGGDGAQQCRRKCDDSLFHISISL